MRDCHIAGTLWKRKVVCALNEAALEKLSMPGSKFRNAIKLSANYYSWKLRIGLRGPSPEDPESQSEEGGTKTRGTISSSQRAKHD